MSKLDTVAVVCHDAGGAEILSSWVNASSSRCLLVLEGPAVSVFSRKCVEQERMSLATALAECDWLLCGTGWQSDFEKIAIASGKKKKKKTIAFLDHWVNYRTRFLDRGREILPDEIWVADEHAKRIAEAEFPALNIVQKSNFYVAELMSELEGLDSESPCSDSSKVDVLYICEPIREHAFKYYGDERFLGYTEEEALKYFLSHVSELFSDLGDIVVRPHPAEPVGKYEWAVTEFDYSISISKNSTLLSDISKAKVVVGCESMAMAVAVAARRRVLSVIPVGGRRCQLPYKEIEHLSEILAKVG